MNADQIKKNLNFMERWKFISRSEYVVIGMSAFVLSGILESADIIEIVVSDTTWQSLEKRFLSSIEKGDVPFNYVINWSQFNVRVNNPDHRLKWVKETVDDFKVLSIDNYVGTKLYIELTAAE